MVHYINSSSNSISTAVFQVNLGHLFWKRTCKDKCPSCTQLTVSKTEGNGHTQEGYKGIHTQKLPCIVPERDRTASATTG